MHQVDIALGLYNGASFLPEFLDSLEKQSFQDWGLVVRDDGSRDESVAIVQRWCAQHGRPLKLLEDDLGNLRVIGNFSECLRHTEAPYVMLADQDDVWLPHKIEDAVTEMRRMESEAGDHTPIAIYCDLEVVDASLKQLHPSFLELQGQGQRRLPTLPQLLTQNVAPGCSMVVNRALLSVGLPIPSQAAMHDWWLMLLARALGRVGHLRRPGIAYRQHGGNQVGARRGGLMTVLKEARRGPAAYLARLQQTRSQARALAERLPQDHPHLPMVRLYGTLDQVPRPMRQFRAWRAGFDKVGQVRNVVFFLLM
jgi:glycosyltransferase involved in cell wall biosynthesis